MMDIRPYDIVEFNGEQYRVMSVRPYINEVRIASYGWVDMSGVTLLESIDVPTFNIGDEVFIKPIDDKDRDEYSAGWGGGMDELVNTQSTVVEVDETTQVCKSTNGYWFANYHLENINYYDMI